MKQVRRTRLLNVRVTEEERTTAERRAAELGLDLSEYLRLQLFGRPPVGLPSGLPTTVDPGGAQISITVTGPVFVGGREEPDAEEERPGPGPGPGPGPELEVTDRGRMLTVEEAAERLGTGVRFIRRLVAERRIRYVKLGRHVRIPESALEAFIAEGEGEGTGG